jgi:hypothetical protein
MRLNVLFELLAVSLAAIFLMHAVSLIQHILAQSPITSTNTKTNTTRVNGTAECNKIKIDNYSFHDNGQDKRGLRIIGIVENNSTQKLSNINIIAEFYDKKGTLLDLQSSSPMVMPLEKGQKSPVKLRSPNLEVTTVDHYTLRCATS